MKECVYKRSSLLSLSGLFESGHASPKILFSLIEFEVYGEIFYMQFNL